MYKLTIVGGPNRGTSYVIQKNGETTIGRHGDNVVVLPSARVSKRHCSIGFEDGEMIIKDLGSSNGTFVNGVLAKAKQIKPGDKLSVGEYIFEITDPNARPAKKAPGVAGFGNIILANSSPALPAGIPMGTPGGGMGMPAGNDSDLNPNEPPRDLIGKAAWAFEKFLMPTFYSLNLKYQWRFIVLGLIGVVTIADMFISIYPLLESGRNSVLKETGTRARYIARQIAEQNAAAVASGSMTKTELGMADSADGVRLAVLIDLDSRVLAPASKAGQYLVSGAEARFAIRMRDRFRSGDTEKGAFALLDNATIAAVEPVRIFNPRLGRNVVAGMAVVSIDTSLVTLDMGEMGVIYSKTLILTGIIGVFIFMILRQLTLRPYRMLAEDLEKGLKGDISQVTHEYQVEEANQLWELIDSALQRIPKGGLSESQAAEVLSVDTFLAPVRAMAESGKAGVVLCDGERKIAYLNSIFEEISAIRADSSIGHAIQDVARDQAFGAFTNDLFDRVSSQGALVSEDYEFSGISYKVNCSAFAMPGGQVRGYLLNFTKAEG